MSKVKTHISKAYWCMTRDKICTFEPARFSFGGKGDDQEISWFDELLEGGIELFSEDIFTAKSKNEKIMPITFLITGPPGSGKTTLAMELCYRMAKEEKKLSQYISTESESYKLIQNAERFGYHDASQIILSDLSGFDTNQEPRGSFVIVTGKEQFRKKDTSKFTEILDLALQAAVDKFSVAGTGAKLRKIIDPKQYDKIAKYSPDILVIDSLNIIEQEERKGFFEKLLNNTKYGGSGILICIIDDPSPDKQFSSWTHVCDIVINLNYTNIKDYYLRTLEIVKARYQSHAWGKHQLKIYPRNEITYPKRDTREDEEDRITYNQNTRRAHPYRKEGGIFIYPSIHFFLSKYKRIAHRELPRPVATVPETLNKILQFPYGRCSALFGCRGAHKSHLAFLNILHSIYKYDEKGIIISLRDDEEMTKRTMSKILLREFTEELTIPPDDNLPAEDDLKDERLLQVALASLTQKIDENKLEILYFHPGYITPEEFYHRIFMSIQKLKREPNTKLTVIFNSLDQLSARFPLCANQEIFIPSIVTALSGEDVTSLFIAVDEPGQPRELYGLLPLADLVLSFYRHLFVFKDYCRHIELGWNLQELEEKDGDFLKKCEGIKKDMASAKIDAVVMEIVRFAGGRRAGARGLLELVHKHEINEALYKRPGLHFTELSKKVDHGEPIGTYRFPRR